MKLVNISKSGQIYSVKAIHPIKILGIQIRLQQKPINFQMKINTGMLRNQVKRYLPDRL